METLSRRPRRFALLTAALALLAALALGVSACGDDEEARQTLDRAFRAQIGSADVALDTSVRLQGVRQLERPISLRVRGPYRSGGERQIPSADLAVNLTAQGQSFAAGLISNGSNAWVEFLGQAYEVGERTVSQANQQIAASAGQRQQRSLRAFGVDPRSWLVDPSVEGETRVAGADTTHISAGLDVAKMLDDLNRLSQRAGGQAGVAPRQLTQEQRDRVERIVQDPKFDVFVGKDDKVRRLATVLDLEVPEEDRRAAGGAESGRIAFSIEFSNVGRPGPIRPPQDARPIKDLTAQVARMLGAGAGAGAGGAGGGGGAGGLPAPTPGG